MFIQARPTIAPLPMSPNKQGPQQQPAPFKQAIPDFTYQQAINTPRAALFGSQKEAALPKREMNEFLAGVLNGWIFKKASKFVSQALKQNDAVTPIPDATDRRSAALRLLA